MKSMTGHRIQASAGGAPSACACTLSGIITTVRRLTYVCPIWSHMGRQEPDVTCAPFPFPLFSFSFASSFCFLTFFLFFSPLIHFPPLSKKRAVSYDMVKEKHYLLVSSRYFQKWCRCFTNYRLTFDYCNMIAQKWCWSYIIVKRCWV